MTIVANNSITVSNVNDGTITHTAYAYSADGTEGFTTVYPNLNLLKGSKNYTKDNPKTVSFSATDGVFFLNDVSVKNLKAGTYTMSGKADAPWTVHETSDANRQGKVGLWLVSTTPWLDVNISLGDTVPKKIEVPKDGDYCVRVNTYSNGTDVVTHSFWDFKLEPGSIATPYMQSASEVTTADWPKYIGHYTDFMQADSTNPSDYTWGPMRGDDGVGVKSTVITYAISTSGTTAPSTGWTSSVPSLVKGQYLWTKTVWTYTDNSSETGYSVTYISKDGNNGTNGTSGIIVSSVAPDSPKTGQLWQDTSTTPQLVKKWTGNEWVIWELYAQNLKADSLSALSANLGDITGGTVKLMDDNWVINGQPKMYGIYQSKLGLLSSGPVFDTAAIVSDTQMGVANLNRGELRFIVTDYTENLKDVQDAGMSDQNNAFIKFASYENGRDVMTIGSSGDIVFKGITSQDTPWVTLSSGVKYKFMFSRVYISVDVVGNGGSFMQFGTLPQNLRPISDQFMVIANQGTGTADDRHMMVRASDGAVVLWTPKSEIPYRGEVSFTL